MRSAVTVLAGAVLAACGGGEDGGQAQTASAASSEGGIPDGTYACSYSSGGMLMSLGEVVIDGERYGGFSGGRRGAYSVGADGAVEFSDGFAGVPEGFEVSAAEWKPEDDILWISVDSPGGNRMDLDCERQG